MKIFKKLDDESLMPWGKFKGEELQDVPAAYLIWLEGEMKNQNTEDTFKNGVLVYVDENRDVLEKELNQSK